MVKTKKDEKIERTFRVAFVGGGSGGHVSPNLAIISELKKISSKKDVPIDVLYIGRRKGMEKDIIEKSGIKYRGIFTGKLRRYFNWRNFTDPFLILLGFFQSISIIRKFAPDLVFAKGGFVTVPFCLAAKLLGKSFVIHESDSVFGLSNKILLKFAKKVFLGFPPELYRNIPLHKSLFTGNPVREEIIKAKENKNSFYKKYGLNKKPVVFVFGGSQGANALNKAVNHFIEEIVSKYVLVHQTGAKDANYFKQGYFELEEKDRKDYLVYSHIGEEMGEFLANADLIISRAGANSIAEIIALKKISILVPLVGSAADHQVRNASFLKNRGVVDVWEESSLSSEDFLGEIDFLINDKNQRGEMVRNMESIFPENSAKVIAEEMFRSLASGKR